MGYNLMVDASLVGVLDPANQFSADLMHCIFVTPQLGMPTKTAKLFDSFNMMHGHMCIAFRRLSVGTTRRNALAACPFLSGALRAERKYSIWLPVSHTAASRAAKTKIVSSLLGLVDSIETCVSNNSSILLTNFMAKFVHTDCIGKQIKTRIHVYT